MEDHPDGGTVLFWLYPTLRGNWGLADRFTISFHNLSRVMYPTLKGNWGLADVDFLSDSTQQFAYPTLKGNWGLSDVVTTIEERNLYASIRP